MPKFIEVGVDVKAKEVEGKVKNKWRWDWIDHPKPISTKPEDQIPAHY